MNILSLGAGVQSSTLALMAACGEITPMPDAAIFADVGDEPKAVYEWLEFLEKQLPFPVHRVQKGHLSADALTMQTHQKTGKPYAKFMIPLFAKSLNGEIGMVPRQCTTDYKIIPIIKKLRELAEIKRGEKEIKVVQWIGISKDEVQRMRPARDAWIKNRWPLVELDMTRLHCLEWMAKHSYPTPPRSACVFCPYKSDREWDDLKETDKEGWDRAVGFEESAQEIQRNQAAMYKVPFLHQSGVNLKNVSFSNVDSQVDMFDNECEGHCGV